MVKHPGATILARAAPGCFSSTRMLSTPCLVECWHGVARMLPSHAGAHCMGRSEGEGRSPERRRTEQWRPALATQDHRTRVCSCGGWVVPRLLVRPQFPGWPRWRGWFSVHRLPRSGLCLHHKCLSSHLRRLGGWKGALFSTPNASVRIYAVQHPKGVEQRAPYGYLAGGWGGVRTDAPRGGPRVSSAPRGL